MTVTNDSTQPDHSLAATLTGSDAECRHSALRTVRWCLRPLVFMTPDAVTAVVTTVISRDDLQFPASGCGPPTTI